MNSRMDQDKRIFSITAALGIFSFAALLTHYNVADGDLWARLAQGASIWKTGHLIHKDMFAFTAVLPEYVDHEWGAGLIFFSLLKLFGPTALQIFKILTAIGALIFAMAAGRLNHCKWPTLFFLSIPCALTIFPGFVPVVRSQVITYLFFAATLFCLEAIRGGRRLPALAIVTLMAVWVNAHGGFVSGLGIIGIYTVMAVISKRMSRLMLITMMVAICVSFINPYGMKFWDYLISALMLPRTVITEWGPMPLLGWDAFFGFRILFVIAACAFALGWDNDNLKSSPQAMLVLVFTAYLAIRHRRHAPFFGLASAAFLGTYLETAFRRISSHAPAVFIRKIRPMIICVIVYGVIAFIAAIFVLPGISFAVITPTGFYPVREADILMYAKASGNLVAPLRWGNYIMWRLYPRIKISMCGRYEAIYPESTFDMNQDFFSRSGYGWDRIIRQYKVDYIVLELYNTRLRPHDLRDLNFEVVWSDGYSALCARKELAPSLRTVVSSLPSQTIQPLDARVPDRWWQ